MKAKIKALLKGANSNSPDGVGKKIKAEVRLPPTEGPWSGSVFEVVQMDGPQAEVEFRFYQTDAASSKRGEVYRQTVCNPPFCPFGVSEGQCQPVPVQDDTFVWPDSELGSGHIVQQGEYVLEVDMRGKEDPDAYWLKQEGSGNAVRFAIEFELVEADSR